MTQVNLTIYTETVRARALKWLLQAPFGTRLIFKSPKRTLPQNDRMWAMLTDISTQKTHAGRKYTPNVWKILFMHGCGSETKLIPSLDNTTLIPIGQSSSELDVQEASDLMEFMMAWGIENGVKFNDKSPEAEKVMEELRQRKPRVRNEKHLAYIRSLPCCVCGDNTSTEAAHVKINTINGETYDKRTPGGAEKADDKWAVPLCGRCHRDQHAMSELTFWERAGINPLALALTYQS